MDTVRFRHLQDGNTTDGNDTDPAGPDVKCEDGWVLTNETDTQEAKCMPEGSTYCGADKYCTSGLACCEVGQVCCQNGDICSTATGDGNSGTAGISRCCATGYKINPYYSAETGVGCVPDELETAQ